MKKTNKLLLLAVAAFCCVALTARGMSPTTRKWLTLFFDGVPPEHPATNSVAGPSADGEMNVAATPAKTAAPAQPFYYGHPPFVDQKCTSCHEAGMGQGLKKKTPALCFDCHKDFLASAKVKHQPVESGDCMSCHDPHQSEKNNKLLLKTGKDLCFDCHDNFLEKAKVKHQPAENGECASCHNPHASDNKKLLIKSETKLCFECHDDMKSQIAKAKSKHQPAENGECLSCHNPHATDRKKLVNKSTPALCWDCHDNFLEKAKFKHDVVEDCTTCHNPHQSAEGKLLAKNISKLCFDCHEEKDIKAVKDHAGAENKSCVECHDPHIGADKNLLKPGKNPAAPK